METYYFDTLPSTQTFLIEALHKGDISPPAAVRCGLQTEGIGSRNNKWEGEKGNFFASFALEKGDLPDDLSLVSASIYFAYLMRLTLQEAGCKVWVKWPNDLYGKEEKVGGVITKALADTLVWGIGINLKNDTKNFKALHCPVDAEILFNMYLKRLEKLPKWKEIFRLYRIEFDRSRRFWVHVGDEKVSLENARLCEDGSIEIAGKTIVGGR